jgi:AcrR family transcriptional regulator
MVGKSKAAGGVSRKISVTRSNGDLTKEKIINAAEVLFGQHSYDTVSLRDITNFAKVTLALASYHFGTKEKLYAAVIARRAHTLNSVRRARLAGIEKAGHPTVEGLLDAFMRPLFDQMQSDDDGWQAYVLVISKLGQSDTRLDLLSENFDETANLFIAHLKPLLPNLSEEVLMRGFSYMLLLMLQAVSKNRRIDSLSAGRYKAEDLNQTYRLLLKFVTAGLLAL